MIAREEIHQIIFEFLDAGATHVISQAFLIEMPFFGDCIFHAIFT